MKKQLFALSLLAICVSSSALAAGPVANIQVTGDIKPPTCTVNGATQSDVIFDLGKISPSLIPQSDFYLYPSTAIKNVVVIDCDAETYLAFSAIDAYEGSSTIDTAGSSYSDYYFKLVDAKNTSETVGGIIFKWNNVTVDGVDAFLSKDNTGTTQGNAPTYMVKDAMTAWTKTQQNRVEADDLDMISGKVFSAEFSQPNNESYAAFISSRNDLSNNNIDINDGLDFIGEAILTFSFGV